MDCSNEVYDIDPISYCLGMINCFVEMVACGVKTLALSPPIEPNEYEIIKRESDKIVNGFKIKSYLDKELIKTDLQSEDFTKGKWSILYYEDDSILNMYLDLKNKIEELNKTGEYKGSIRKEISKSFGELLSYPEHKIKERLSEDVPVNPFTL